MEQLIKPLSAEAMVRPHTRAGDASRLRPTPGGGLLDLVHLDVKRPSFTAVPKVCTVRGVGNNVMWS